MRILIDIGHPAHVHCLKNLACELQKKGHTFLFTCREKEFVIRFLKELGFNYKSFGRKYSSKFGKLWGLLEFDLKEVYHAIRFKPDIFVSLGSIYASHASFILRKPNISLEDTYNIEQVRLYKPFTNCILTSDYDHPLKSEKILKYAGYHELAYLHPNRFSPDKSVLNELGLKDKEKFVIIRFVAWNASHDIGHKGLRWENKLKAIKEFEKHAKVFISSEDSLPTEFLKYKLPIAPSRIHHAIAFANLLYGESSTMAEEAAMLGTPSIYLFNGSTYYTMHLENEYGLIFNYSESEEDQLISIQKGLELLSIPNLKENWQLKTKEMLSQKIDVTAFLVWFIENYPQSFIIMKENPDYQLRFK